MYYLTGCIGRLRLRRSFLAALLMVAGVSQALEPLDDAEMAGVAGRDGLAVQFDSPAGINGDALILSADSGEPHGVSAILEGLALQGVGGPLDLRADIDVASVGGEAVVRITGRWSELVAAIDDWSLGEALTSGSDYTDPTWLAAKTDSLGSVGIQAGGQFTLQAPGLFDVTSSNSYLDLQSQGAFFYRQGAQGRPELSFRNFSLGASFTDGAGGPGTGTFGIADDGLLVAADHMDLDLFFDLYYAEAPGPGNGFFDPSAGHPMILFGWEGGIENASLRLGSGGLGTQVYNDGIDYFDVDGSETGIRSEGINFTTQWDFGPGFAWRLGQSSASGNEVEVRFTDWQRLGGGGSPAGYDFRLPMTLDTVTPGHYPGGLCFGGALPFSGSTTGSGCGSIGGTYEDLVPQNPAFAMIMRDGRLHAYNTVVEVIDGADTESYDWGLLYTFGKLDANFWLYPEQRGGYPALKSDVLLTIQSPGYWQKAQSNAPTAGDNWAVNTHFMIADTATEVDISGNGSSSDQFGIGLMNADLLWKASNMFIRVTEPGDISGFPGGFALEATGPTRYRFRGMFGGGNLKDMSEPVRMALMDVNLDTDQFIFVLSPAPNANEEYVGFDGLLDFSGDAYFSIAEPSNPEAELQLANISGRFRWENGRVELRSSADNPGENRPSLTIANDLVIGTSAGGDPFRTTWQFDEAGIGELVIPSGRIYNKLTLKPQ